jgi:hypothetical protein
MAELEATFGPNAAVDDTDQGVSFANGDLQINFAQVVDPTTTYDSGILMLEGPFVSNFRGASKEARRTCVYLDRRASPNLRDPVLGLGRVDWTWCLSQRISASKLG